jgi:hypothetical protein
VRATTPPTDLRVGRYRLLTKIGEGGMGVVHLAQAPDGRRVALKVLRPHIVGDGEARERLAREVSSLRRVRSPRVAEVVDADPWGDTPYVATRYVPGLSLHQHIQQEGPLRGDDLRWFAAGLAEAVIAVHSVGVLHRDIKPSNVLLEGRSPVLIDFGLARVAEDPRLTVTGWLLGTPGYLAPEILYGEDATTASDMHSWAATVVYASTGRPPFGRGPAMAIMDRVRRGEHDLYGVPQDLLPLVERCLAPDPADRPETAAVLSSLRASRGDAPTVAGGHDDFTMPFAVVNGSAPDPDATDVVEPATEPTTEPAMPTEVAPPPTRPLTAPHPATAGPRPDEAWPSVQPARAPYVQPPPPGPAPEPVPSPLARFQRGCVLAGLLAVVALGFARAPYLSLAAVALAAWLLRTVSWTTEAASRRRYRRGRGRWYDAPLTVLTSPWYLLVATAGTVVLLVWSLLLACLAALAVLVFGVPVVTSLLAIGAVLGLGLWSGPGSRRLRSPSRRLTVHLTRRPGLGWLLVLAVGVAALVCGYFLTHSGVLWDPAPGPPWRDGTVVGDLMRFL